jgi:hypothetical protein
MSFKAMFAATLLMVSVLGPAVAQADRGARPPLRTQIMANAKTRGVLTGLNRPTLRLVRQGNRVTATISALQGGGVRGGSLTRQAVERATFTVGLGLDGERIVKQSAWKNVFVPRP